MLAAVAVPRRRRRNAEPVGYWFVLSAVENLCLPVEQDLVGDAEAELLQQSLCELDPDLPGFGEQPRAVDSDDRVGSVARERVRPVELPPPLPGDEVPAGHSRDRDVERHRCDVQCGRHPGAELATSTMYSRTSPTPRLPPWPTGRPPASPLTC